MSTTPTFEKPSVVELVLGDQFSPLTKLTDGHFGLFWKELGTDWVKPLDGPLIEDQFESFDRPRGLYQLVFLLCFSPCAYPDVS